MPNATSITVQPGTPVVVSLLDRAWGSPWLCTIVPGGGGSGRVEASLTPTAVSSPGTASWLDSGFGAVVAATEVVRSAPCVAVRLTATTQPCVFHIVS